MKVLLTGCFGFIGSHVAARLLQNSYKVLGFDNLTNPSINPTDRIKQVAGENWKNLTFFNQDIRGRSGMLSICAVEKPDAIVHLAALGSISRSFADPSETIDVNERGFANVLCLASAIGIKRVVFASSSNVYGDSKNDPKREGEEGQPQNPYGLSKRQNEIMARIWQQKTGIEYIGLRFFNVYGPGQNPNGPYAAVIPRFIMDKELTIYGDGSNTRDFTFVGDVAETIHRFLYSEAANFCVNVGAGEKTSILELAHILADGRNIVHKEARAGEIKHSRAAVGNLKRILSYSPTTSLRDGLMQTVEYYKWLRNQAQDGRSNQDKVATQMEAQQSPERSETSAN